MESAICDVATSSTAPVSLELAMCLCASMLLLDDVRRSQPHSLYLPHARRRAHAIHFLMTRCDHELTTIITMNQALDDARTVIQSWLPESLIDPLLERLLASSTSMYEHF